MKAITILQPFASLIACGAKQIETRSWATKYRGKIAIYAGKSFPQPIKEMCWSEPFWSELLKADIKLSFCNMPFGAVIATADLVDCFRVIGRVYLTIGDEKRVAVVLENDMKVMGNELEFGDYSIDRYAWILQNVRRMNLQILLTAVPNI